jgi:hypothetical protein
VCFGRIALILGRVDLEGIALGRVGEMADIKLETELGIAREGRGRFGFA